MKHVHDFKQTFRSIAFADYSPINQVIIIDVTSGRARFFKSSETHCEQNKPTQSID